MTDNAKLSCFAGPLLIDGSPFANTCQRGIQRYLFELLRRLDVSKSILLDSPCLVPLPPGCNTVVRKEYFPAPKWNLPLRLIRKSMRMVHPTGVSGHPIFFTANFAPVPTPGIISVTVAHDMVPELLPHYFNGNADSEISRKKRSFESANSIIAISEATRSDLILVYPELEPKVTVITHGADHFNDELPAERNRHLEPEADIRYALFVGDRFGYKNFARLIDALADPSWPDDLVLKVVGANFNAGELTALAARGLCHRVENVGPVSDDALRRMYQEATVFIFPSLAEGFGFPLLEAQSLGVPCAASDIAVFHEVGGEGVEFFDPHDPHSIATAVSTISDRDRTSASLEPGFSNVRKFQWQSAAGSTASLFASLIES